MGAEIINMPITEQYKMSFTTAGLLRNETMTIAALFVSSRNWAVVQRHVMDENCIQLKAMSSRRRIFREIRMRLEKLSAGEMELLTSGTSRDVDAILWLSICRLYGFIGDFAREVIREKSLSLQRKVEFVDFNLFVEQKAVIHPELLALTDSTMKRLRQILFSFMRNCGLIDRDGNIQPVLLSPALMKIMKDEMVYFPMMQGEA